MKTTLTTILRGLGLVAGVVLLAPMAMGDTLAAGYDFAGSIDSTGVLRTWGDNALGQLGQGTATTTSVSQPAPVAGSHHWSSVAMGQDFTLAIDTSTASTPNLWAWGSNASGQLGIGGTTASSSPVKVALPVGSLVQAVAAGQAFSVALVNIGTDHGRIYAWGSGTSGQLGQGNSSSSSTPVFVNTGSRRFTAVTATAFAVVAIATDGSLWAWGDNGFGEIGQGIAFGAPSFSFTYTTPIQVGTAVGWTQVKGGYGHVLALQGSKLWVWGFNNEGQVGNGVSGQSVMSPTQIASGQTWAAIGAGQYHSLAVDSTGALWSWGLNINGELDLPVSQQTANVFTTPQATGLEAGLAPWAAITGGNYFTVARNAAGGVYAVGDNTFGELGNGAISSTLNFTPAFGLALVSGVSLAAGAPAVPSVTLGVNAIAQPVTVTVQNSGSATETASYVVSVYLSSDGSLDSGSLLLASSTQSTPLAGLGSTTVTFSAPNLAIPGVPPGAYQLISQVTPVGGNPVAGAPTAVTLVGPDLTLQNLTVGGSTTVAGGGTFTGVTATLSNGNLGVLPAVSAGGTPLVINVWLGTQSSHTAADLKIGSFTYSGGLAASSSVVLPAQSFTVPLSVVGGAYQLFYTVNDDNAVAETGLLPDFASTTVFISTVDLAVTAPTTTTTSLGVNATLANVSTFAQNVKSATYSSGYTLNLYLSASSTLDGTATLLQQSSVQAGALAPNSSAAFSWTNVTVPNVTPGSYFLLSQVVQAAGQTDGNPTNNVAATPVTIVGTDLTLTNPVLTGGTTTAPGGSFTGASYQLNNLNAGVVPAGTGLLVQTYLSTAASFNTSTSTLLDSYTYSGGIAAGPASVALPTAPRTISVPAGTPGGAYNLFFVVNGNNAVAESALGAGVINNVLTVPVTISAADLAVTAPTTATTSLGVNAKVASVSTFAQNVVALTYSGGYTLNLYLSASSTLDGTATLLQQSSVQAGSLAPSSSAAFSWTNVTVPNVAPGSYFLLSQVVLAGGLVDGNAANNVASTPVTIVGTDLTLTNPVLTGGTTTAPGGSFTGATYQLNNLNAGVIPAGTGLLVQTYLSTAATFNLATSTLVDSYTYTGGIAAGPASVALPTAPRTISVPAGTPGGAYNLFFVVNGNNAVAESALGVGVINNVLAVPVTISAPDLAVTAPTTSTTSLGVNATLATISTFAQNVTALTYSGGYTLNLYLSASSTLDGTATLLQQSSVQAGSLAPSSSAAFSWTNVTVPNVAPGSYFLLSQVVLAGGLVDGSAANNVGSTPVTIVGSDLTLTNPVLTGGTTTGSGGSFTGVTYQLNNLNLGVIPAGTGLLVQTFLSTAATFNTATSTLLDSYTYSGGIAAAPASVALPTAPRTINVPVGTPGGAYNLFFVVNGNNAVAESALGTGTISNVLAVPVTISTADLAVTSPTTATTSLGINATLSTVSTFVANLQSATYSGGYTLNLYLSASSTLDGTATLLKTSVPAGSLAPSSSTAFSWTNVTVPNVAPGSYFLLSQVVLATGQVDANLGNNVAASPVTVVGSDLTLTNPVLAGGTTVVSGASFTGVTYRLNNLNLGVIPAGTALLVQTYLSTAATFNAATSTLLDSYTYSGGIGAVPATVVLPTAPRSITVPAGTAGGSYNLFFVVNSNNAVAESALGAGTINNVLAVPVTITAADLAVTAPTTSTSTLGVNASLASVSSFAQNVAAVTYSGGYTLNLYLSASSTLDGTATLLQQSSVQAGSLAPSSSAAFSWTNVTVPNVTPGGYFLLSQVVLAAGQTDGNSANNVASTPITIVGSDLTLTNPVLAGGNTTGAGGSFTGVTYQLNNLNAGVIPAGTPLLVQTYLSTAATFNLATSTLLDSYTYSGGIAAGPASVALPTAPRTIGVPAGTPGGAYNLFFVVNGNSAVAESALAAGTINNVLTVPVTISAPDLAVTAPATSSTSLGVSATLASVSTFAQNVRSVTYSGGYTLNLYLSASSTLDGTATLLQQSSVQAGALAPSSSAAFSWTNVTVPNVAPGSYFLLSQVVLAGGQVDGNSANNVAAAPITIVGSDLTLTNPVLTGGNTTGPGGSFTGVTYQLNNLNLGVIPAGTGLLVQTYLSTAATFNLATSTLLDSYTYSGGIAAGPASVALPTAPRTIGVPVGTPGGAYNLFFVVNANNAVAESALGAGTINHVLTVPVTISTADLSVSAPTTSTTSLGINATLASVSSLAANVKSVAYAGGYTLNLYLSTSSVLDGTATLLQQSSVQAGALAPNSSAAFSWTNVTVPNVAPGSYFLLGQVVLASGQVDGNLANNVASAPVTIVASDLTLTNPVLAGGSTTGPGGSFTGVTYQLNNLNLGVIPAGTGLLVQTFLSTAATFNAATSTLVDSYTYSGGIAAAPALVALPTAPRTIGVPAGTPVGAYNLFFVVNGNSAVAESALGAGTINNVLAVPVTISAPDLAVTSPTTATTSLGINATLASVSTFAQNVKSATYSGGYTLNLYLSASSVLDGTATLLQSSVQAGALAPSSSAAFSWTNVTVPNVAPGGYFLLSQVVLAGGQVDGNSANNVASTPVTIVGSDLTLTNPVLTGGNTTGPGGSFTGVTYQLNNLNAGVIPAGTPLLVQTYLSTAATFNLATSTLVDSYTYSGGIAAGPASVTLPTAPRTITVPAGTPGGAYNLFLVVNANNAVAESALGAGTINNVLTVPVDISAPDLAVSAPATATTSLGVNATLASVSTFAQNVRSVTYSGGYTLNLYLSASATLDGTATLLQSSVQAGSLAPNFSTAISWTNVTVPNVAPGSYFLLSQVVLVGGQVDGNSANNVASTPVTIVGSDLTLTNPVMAGGNLALPGGSFTGVSYQLNNLNAGVIPAGRPLLVQTYLSTAATFNLATSTLVDSYTYSGGIAAGPASVALPTAPRTIGVPAGTPGGAYNLFFVVNANNAVAESALGAGTINNVLTVPVTISSVDLAITAPATSATSLGVSSKLASVTTFAENVGASTYSAGYTLNLYLSASSTLDGTATLLQTATPAGSLAPNSSASFTWTNVTVPNVAPGSYFLLSQIVPAAGQTDGNPANNVASTAVTVVGSDLTLSNPVLAGGTTTNPGGSFTGVTYQLNNLNAGVIPAGTPLLVQTFLSTASTFNATTSILLDSYTYSGGIAAGPATVALPTAPRTITVPAGTAGGAYNLFFVVNGNNAVAQSALGTGTISNVLAVPVTIGAVDLAVTVPTTATTSVGVNGTVGTVSTFVENIGTLPYSAGYTLNLYLSASATLDGTAILLQSSPQAGSLAALGSAAFNWSNVSIPNVAPGGYFLLSQVVLAAGQTDGNPANNVAATPITVVAPAFTVGGFNFPNTTSIGAGGSFGNVTYTLTDTGAGAVPANHNITIQVYLSTTTTFSAAADVLLDQYVYTGGLGAGGSVLLPSPAHGINLPANIANGVYQMLFVVNNDGAVAGAPVSVTAQQVAVGAINASVTAPALANLNLGVNTILPSTSVTVNNLGGFSIPPGTVVNLYLSPNTTVNLGNPLLGSQTISSQIPGGTGRSVTFTGITVPDAGQGPFNLVSQIVLPPGLIDLNPAGNVAATPVTLQRPSMQISNIAVANTINLNLPSPQFSGVTFTLGDTSLGAVPAGTAVLLEVYLATTPTLNPSNQTLLYSTSYVGGLSGVSAANIPAFNIPVPAGTVGGSYYLIFVANRDRNVNESSSVVATGTRQVFLQKTNAPGLALGYGTFSFGGAGQWFSVTDTRTSTGQAFQSPVLAQGQSATITLNVTGPTTVNAPWLIVGGGTDTVGYTVDGSPPAALTSGTLTIGEQYQITNYTAGDSFTNVGAASNATGVTFVATGTTPAVWTHGSSVQPVSTLTGFIPPYQPSVVAVPAGNHVIVWTYTQNSATTTAYARLNLQLPSFIASGDGSWFGVSDPTSPVNNTYAQSPTLQSGQQAALQVGISGPALASFWWRTASVASQDTLSFFIDGQLASLPTTTFFAAASPATISGNTAWANVAFLVGPGTHTLKWVYSQNSQTSTSAGFVAGLQVLSPIPATNTPNSGTNAVQYGAVPPSNIDLAVTNVTAATGTYLLDDAAGTGVLPVSITVTNVGSDFSAVPSWDAADLEIHLSTDTVFGNSDDIDLGSFANLDTVNEGDQVVFQGDIDLPFNVPAGNYYLLVEYGGSSSQSEFTLANNTAVVGPGFNITRAPRLVITNFSGLASNYPYHPQDGVYLTFNLGNIGLADVTPSMPFEVQVSLMAVAAGTFPSTNNGTVIKAYTPVNLSVFLPQVSGEFPNGGTTPITNYLNLPTIRDTLVALGIIPKGTPEDSGPVYANAAALSGYQFYWSVVVDPTNAIVQSSTANVWTFFNPFTLTSVPTELNVGQYFGQAAFGSYVSTESAALSGTSYNAAASPASADGQFTSLITAYATGQSLTGSPQTLFQTTNQNGYPSLTIPPGLTGKYLTQTFDFNVRANDIAIDVQSSPDLVTWSTLVTLSPPYFGTAGAQSLTGVGGLLDNPFVLSVTGNSTSVAQDYLARVTVRDSVPAPTSGSRFMRLNIRPLAAAPAAPGSFQAVFDITTEKSDLSWTGALPTIQDPFSGPGNLIPAGAYVIERASSVTPNNFVVVGQSTTNFFSETLTVSGSYIYRIRAITTGGASAAQTAVEVVPNPP